MTTIETMQGPLETGELGFVLMHEHVFIRSPGMLENWPHNWDVEAEVAHAVDECRRARAAGIDTIVDLTAIDLGRDIPLLRRVADEVDLNIVVCTGFLSGFVQAPFFVLNERSRPSVDATAANIAYDIEVGIADSGVRAGIIKLGTEPVVDDMNEYFLRAGARAHRTTGVPISTHSFPRNKTGLTQLDVFDDEGVDPERVVIGHSGDSEDLEYLTAIVRRGAYLGMDRFGVPDPITNEGRLAVVAEMCHRGHADKMVISADTACWGDSLTPEWRAAHIPESSYTYVPDEVVPALSRLGVSSHDIDLMSRVNPRRIFERQGSY